MGLMRLFVHDQDRLSQIDPARVFMAGLDELPWFGHVIASDGELIVQRAESESGYVTLPWHVQGQGELLISTATLIERERPYFLEVELARGFVQRVRTQLASWELVGLVVPATLRKDLAAATHDFCQAATRQHDRPTAARFAESAIDKSAQLANNLAAEYARQALTARLSTASRLGTLSGVKLTDAMPAKGARDPIKKAFNLVALPCSWRAIEASEGKRKFEAIDEQIKWAQQSNLKIMAGPLLVFDERHVPDWTYLWEGDSHTLGKLMIEHVRSVVKKLRGRVQIWHVASRMNRDHVLSLDEEQRLQLVAQAVSAVRELDARTPIIVSFDQPWAEYMATRQTDLAPWHYADALVRADLGIAGLGIELNIGPQPHASASRTPLALSRLLDQWSLFDLPLLVSLSRGEHNEVDTPGWLENHLPLLVAKNCVQLVVWNQLTDEGAELPGAGLFDDSDKPKPSLDAWRKLRESYLT
jgi:hypothetical protein